VSATKSPRERQNTLGGLQKIPAVCLTQQYGIKESPSPEEKQESQGFYRRGDFLGDPRGGFPEEALWPEASEKKPCIGSTRRIT